MAITLVLVLASTPSEELENFATAKFYCSHAPADGNYCIPIRQKHARVLVNGDTYTSNTNSVP